MAECAEDEQLRHEWYELLGGVKKTVEGLLASQTSNVWSTYGGLNRLRNNVARILNHRLKVTQGPYGSVLDYWNFIRGLRYLAPAYAHTIGQMQRLCSASGDLSPGQTWVRQSLLDHSLSAQLTVLTASPPYLRHHYYDDAFLCQPAYLQALLLCLRAVEENRAALLADLNPALLSNVRHSAPQTTAPYASRPKVSHVRSASLPCNNPQANLATGPEDEEEMIRRRKSDDPLAPPSRSPKTDTVPIGSTKEHARPSIDVSPESAKDALLQVLSKTGDIIEKGDEVSFYTSLDKFADPLLNVDTFSHTAFTGPPHSYATFPGLQDGSRNAKRVKSSHQFQGRHPLRSRSCSSGEGLDFAFDQEGDDKENYRNGQSNRSSRVSLSQVDAILESPDHHPTNQYRARHPSTNQSSVFCEVQRTGTIIISDHKPKSTDSGVSSPPSRSVLFPTTELQTLDFPPVQKKPTHTRSTSDVGLFQRQTSLDTGRLGAFSPTPDLSSSVPTETYSETRRSSEVYFPQPSKGQSLLSFLSSQDFHTCAELDKENAHFSISEALIAAIEQMKWNQILRPPPSSDDHEMGDSDEEIQDLKQQIRIRREFCLKEKARGFPAFCDVKLDPTSASSSDTPTTCSDSSLHASPPITDSSGEETSGPDADVIDADINEDADNGKNASSLMTLKQSGLSLSMASLYSDLELQKANSSLEHTMEKSTSSAAYDSSQLVSAESVAISLLKRFSEKQLPKASDLQWLVTEQEAPQALLPLPNSYPVSPDDNENADLSHSSKMTRLRGNLEWAPPRAQIIFNIHPAPKRKVVLAKQNYCCAGCGAKVEPGYMKRYRYCEYLGKYFCPRCHTNALAYIPGRILRKWDFTKYYVSNFSFELLKKMYSDPLFSVVDINNGLYRKVRVLDMARESRVQLQHLRVFLQTCRNGQSMLEGFKKSPSHWTTDVHIYSIDDLVQLKKNELLPQLKCLVSDAITHVQQCQLCQAKGFICETCNSDDIIYPFELHTVAQCEACKACYHKTCYNPDKCLKCVRIEARRKRLAELAKEPFSESSEDSSEDSSDDNSSTNR